MAERQSINEVVQIVPEVTPGTAVTLATRRMAALMIDATPSLTTKEYKAMGYRFPTVSALNKEWTDLKVDGPQTYDELAYVFSMMFGRPVITTPGGGTLSRDLQWSPSTSSPLSPLTFTVEQGSSFRAARIAGMQLTDLSMDFTRDECKLSGSAIGAQYTDGIQLSTNATYTLTAAAGPPTAGTYTLTVNGATTGAIVFGAAPAVVQTALEALTGVGVGQVIVTLLANGPTTTTASTTYTIEFRGTLAGTVVTVTGVFTTLTPSGSITVPAGVVGATPTSLSLLPVLPTQVSIYSDPTFGALGTTKLLRALTASIKLSSLYGPLWVLNSAIPSYVAAPEQDPGATFTMSQEADAAGMAGLTNVRAGTKSFIRIEAIGTLIEGALYYRLRLDLAVQVTGVKFGDTQGVRTVDFDYALLHDTTWTRALQLNLRNTLVAIT